MTVLELYETHSLVLEYRALLRDQFFFPLNSSLTNSSYQLFNFSSLLRPILQFNVVSCSRPQITVTVQELYETHSLVLEYRPLLAPSPHDPLHAVLNALPDPDTTLANTASAKQEICLVLSNKFSFSEPVQVS